MKLWKWFGMWLCSQRVHSPGEWLMGNRMKCKRCGEIYEDLS